MNDELKRLIEFVKETFRGWILFSLLVLAGITIVQISLDWFRTFFIENLGETFSVIRGILFWIAVIVIVYIVKALLAKRREKKWHEEISSEYKRHKDREGDATQVVFFGKEPKQPNKDE